MTTTCPNPDAWFRLLDGEATRNEESSLREHLADCSACQRALRAEEELLSDVRAPLAERPDSLMEDRVMAAVARSEVAPPRRRGWMGVGAVVLVASLVVAVGLRSRTDDEGLQARGGVPTDPLLRRVGVQVLSGEVEVRDGAALITSAPLSIVYRNLETSRPVFVMAFVVDAVEDVHWIFPAFTDPKSDPSALALATSSRAQRLPESTVLEAPALGAARVVVLTSYERRRVSEIEALSPADRTPVALASRFPDARIEARAVRLVERTP